MKRTLNAAKRKTQKEGDYATHRNGDQTQTWEPECLQEIPCRSLARDSEQDLRMQYQELFRLPQGRLSLRLLGILRQ